jgi:NAD(P)-dependent dehydrogenase (short-subunit alcohol dehydrogenase family)
MANIRVNALSVSDELIGDDGARPWVIRFAQREAVWFGRRGARICSVSPGIIDTPQGRQEAAAHDSMEGLVRMTPLGRRGQPQEAAAVTAFLLSDQASFVNGIDVPVDGGVAAAIRARQGDTVYELLD